MTDTCGEQSTPRPAAPGDAAAALAALRHNLGELCDSAADGTVPVVWLRQMAGLPSPG
jgi:hypothetical protein